MNLNHINVQRIKRDKEILKNANLESQNIYIKIDDDIESPVKVMIVGPENTPYEGGFYMFEFKFTKNYPWKPPIGKFLTTDGKSRMHPNLYAKEGKICLSLLGTWSGPSWTACQTILSVIISLIPLFNEYPLQCEPSYEIHNGPTQRHKDYNEFIRHENLRLAVIESFTNPPKGYECFKPIIQKKMVEFIPKYIDTCNKYKSIKSITSSIYTCVRNTEYKNMISIFKDYAKSFNVNIQDNHNSSEKLDEDIDNQVSKKELKNTISKKLHKPMIMDISNQEITIFPKGKVKVNIINITKTIDEIKQKQTKKIEINASSSSLENKPSKRVPNEKASDYPEGFVKVSQNDGREYITKKYTKIMKHNGLNKIEYNRWILKK